jgi:hypothetical protein
MKLLVLSVVAMGATAACTGKENNSPRLAKPQPARMASVVVVPESVRGKWKAVEIAVSDKSARKQQIYTIAIGSEFKLPGSDLTLKVENFLPHFVMEGTTLTSQSNELKNPAAQLVISEGGHEIFRGWLFRLYPTTHAFQHPQFGFTLVDYIPASRI